MKRIILIGMTVFVLVVAALPALAVYSGYRGFDDTLQAAQSSGQVDAAAKKEYGGHGGGKKCPKPPKHPGNNHKGHKGDGGPCKQR